MLDFKGVIKIFQVILLLIYYFYCLELLVIILYNEIKLRKGEENGKNKFYKTKL